MDDRTSSNIACLLIAPRFGKDASVFGYVTLRVCPGFVGVADIGGDRFHGLLSEAEKSYRALREVDASSVKGLVDLRAALLDCAMKLPTVSWPLATFSSLLLSEAKPIHRRARATR